MGGERGTPGGRDGARLVVVATLLTELTIAATAATTDEEIAATAADAGAKRARAVEEAMRRARREAKEAEAAFGGTGPYGFPIGMAAAAPAADDPTPIDPISARAREHPRVREVYRRWFGARSGPDAEEE